MPTFSFVVPVLNAEHTLEATLNSIRKQAFRPFEIIVVDNGSTDKTRDVALRFPGVKYIFHKERGRSRARNMGAARAKGDYVAFVDADVVLSRDWLARSARYLLDVPLDALATRVERLPEGTNWVDSYRKASATYQTAGTFLSVLSPHGPTPLVNTAACIFRRKSFNEVGGFDVELLRHEDLELSIRLFSKGYLIGGTSSAKATVRFVIQHSFPKSRELAYLWRAFELQYMTLIKGTQKYKVNWPLLNTLVQQDWSLGSSAYGLLVEFAKLAGKACASVSRSQTQIHSSVGYCRNALSFSFSHQKTHYHLQKLVHFIFVDKDVFVLSMKENSRRFRCLAPLESAAIQNLNGGKHLSIREKTVLLKSGCFAGIHV